MKKIIFTILLLFLVPDTAFCENIKFIYLNGANAHTTLTKVAYANGIIQIQNAIKIIFEKDKFINKTLLENGRYTIDETPKVVFWGFLPKKDTNYLHNLLKITDVKSPFFAQKIRAFLVLGMHDLIWLQDNKNMQQAINCLHKEILDLSKTNSKFIISGHSAGGYITYEYLIHRLKYYNSKGILTCLDAINKENETENICIPDNKILGVMNFGSSLSLFYPSVYQKKNKLFKYMKDKNMFFITVNFADDPLSIPDKINSENSILYNSYTQKSPATFLSSHLSYWRYPKKYAKILKQAYISFYNQK